MLTGAQYNLAWANEILNISCAKLAAGPQECFPGLLKLLL